ncbi:MAG: hypothetical protein II309_00075 [Bacilli bacterium]|nr:hypothetical protein [Bacilli bacterium]
MLNKLIIKLKKHKYKIKKVNDDVIEILFPNFYVLIFVTYDSKYMVTFMNYEGKILSCDTRITIAEVFEYIKLANKN